MLPPHGSDNLLCYGSLAIYGRMPPVLGNVIEDNVFHSSAVGYGLHAFAYLMAKLAVYYHEYLGLGLTALQSRYESLHGGTECV